MPALMAMVVCAVVVVDLLRRGLRLKRHCEVCFDRWSILCFLAEFSVWLMRCLFILMMHCGGWGCVLAPLIAEDAALWQPPAAKEG